MKPIKKYFLYSFLSIIFPILLVGWFIYVNVDDKSQYITTYSNIEIIKETKQYVTWTAIIDNKDNVTITDKICQNCGGNHFSGSACYVISDLKSGYMECYKTWPLIITVIVVILISVFSIVWLIYGNEMYRYDNDISHNEIDVIKLNIFSKVLIFFGYNIDEINLSQEYYKIKYLKYRNYSYDINMIKELLNIYNNKEYLKNFSNRYNN